MGKPLLDGKPAAADGDFARLAAVLAAPVAKWLSSRGAALVRHWVPTSADAVLNSEAARLLAHHEALRARGLDRLRELFFGR